MTQLWLVCACLILLSNLHFSVAANCVVPACDKDCTIDDMKDCDTSAAGHCFWCGNDLFPSGQLQFACYDRGDMPCSILGDQLICTEMKNCTDDSATTATIAAAATSTTTTTKTASTTATGRTTTSTASVTAYGGLVLVALAAMVIINI